MKNKHSMIQTSLTISFRLVIAIGLFATIAQAQTTNVGVNTSTPKATLDVTGTSTTTEADGILVPRLTKANLALKDAAYGADQNGAMVFITDASSTTTGKTVNITATGFHFYNHATAKWKSVNGISTTAMPNFFVGHGTSTSSVSYTTPFTTSVGNNVPTNVSSFLVSTAATLHISFDSYEDEETTYELIEVIPTNTNNYTASTKVADCSTAGWTSGAPINASMSYAASAGKIYSLKVYKTGGTTFTSAGGFFTSFYAD